MPIIVFQHAAAEGLGRLAPILRDHGHVIDIRRLYDAGTGRKGVPVDFDGVDGVISLGGPMNVTDDPRAPWMDAEMAYLAEAHRRMLPVLGICLGAQMLAKALGGEVGAMTNAAGQPSAEFGFAPVKLNLAGQTDTLLAGVAWTSEQFHVHGQEIKKAPDGATILASSAGCKIQAFKVGLRSYGFQYHFESTKPDIEGFVAATENRDLMQRAGISAGDVRAQLDQLYSEYDQLGQRIAMNFAQYMFPPIRAMR
jgi:GMP synthase (glutamine-hydrolysing)